MDYPLKSNIRHLINLLNMRLIYYLQCAECESNNIWYDDLKGELFCQDCGLILEERFKLISIPDIIDYLKYLEKKERDEMMKKISWWNDLAILQSLGRWEGGKVLLYTINERDIIIIDYFKESEIMKKKVSIPIDIST